jgi:hypothetical protein
MSNGDEIDHGNVLHCVDWLAAWGPQEIVDSLMATFRQCEWQSRADMRARASALCVIGGFLMDAIDSEPPRKRKAE